MQPNFLRNLSLLAFTHLLITACGDSNVKLEPGPALAALPETTKKVEEQQTQINAQAKADQERAKAKENFQALVLQPAAEIDPKAQIIPLKLAQANSSAAQLATISNAPTYQILQGKSFSARALANSSADTAGPVRIDLFEDTYIYASRFHLKANESLNTNGYDLTIVADTLEIDGQISTTPSPQNHLKSRDGGNLKIYAGKLITSETTRIDLSGGHWLNYRGRMSLQDRVASADLLRTLAELRPDLFGTNLKSDPTLLLNTELGFSAFRLYDGTILAREQLHEGRDRWAAPVYEALLKMPGGQFAPGVPSRFQESFSSDPSKRDESIKKIGDDLEDMVRSMGLGTAVNATLNQEIGRNYRDLKIEFELLRQGISPLHPEPKKVIDVRVPPFAQIVASNEAAQNERGRPGVFTLVVGQALGRDLLYASNTGLYSRAPSRSLVVVDSKTEISMNWQAALTAHLSWEWKSSTSGIRITTDGTSFTEESQKLRLYSDEAEIADLEAKLIAEELAQVEGDVKTSAAPLLKAWSAGYEDKWIEIFDRLTSENLPGFNSEVAPFQRFKSIAEAQARIK